MFDDTGGYPRWAPPLPHQTHRHQLDHGEKKHPLCLVFAGSPFTTRPPGFPPINTPYPMNPLVLDRIPIHISVVSPIWLSCLPSVLSLTSPCSWLNFHMLCGLNPYPHLEGRVLETASKFLKIKSMPRFFYGKLSESCRKMDWLNYGWIVWENLETRNGMGFPVIRCSHHPMRFHNLKGKQNDQFSIIFLENPKDTEMVWDGGTVLHMCPK